MRPRRMVCGLALALGMALPLEGQASDTTRAGIAAVRLVVNAALGSLTDEVAAAIFTTTRTPWLITVPDSTSEVWRTARAGLMSILAARPVKAADTVVRGLEFRSLVIRGDSLVANFAISHRYYCRPHPLLIVPEGGGWMATGSSWQIHSQWVAGQWSRPTNYWHVAFDGFCMHRAPPRDSTGTAAGRVIQGPHDNLAGNWGATFTLDSAWRLPLPTRTHELAGTITFREAPDPPPGGVAGRTVHSGRAFAEFRPFGFTLRSDEATAWRTTTDSVRIVLNPQVDHGHVELVGRLLGDRLEGGWQLIGDPSGARGRFVLRRRAGG